MSDTAQERDMSDKRISLRVPQYLHDAIEKQAIEQERSVNSQIVYILKTAIEEKGNELQ